MATEIAHRQEHALAPVNDTAAILQVIERAAANPQVDVEKMERLFAMHREMKADNAKASFNAAFARMQAKMPVISERGEIKVNDVVRSKYARFEDINDAVKPVLEEHGFAINFKTKTEGSQITVTGVLMHEEGHSVETDMTLAADTSGSKNSVQSIGSSVSYAKRYVMCALLNITSRGEDDDGGKGGLPRVSEEQTANIEALISEIGGDCRKGFLKYMKVNKVEGIAAHAYPDAIKALEKKRAAK